MGNRYELHITQYILASNPVLELDSEERSGLRNFPWTFSRLSKYGVVKAFPRTQSNVGHIAHIMSSLFLVEELDLKEERDKDYHQRYAFIVSQANSN